MNTLVCSFNTKDYSLSSWLVVGKLSPKGVVMFRLTSIAFTLFVILSASTSAVEELVFEKAVFSGLLVHCASSVDVRELVDMRNRNVEMDEALTSVNGSSAGVLCKREDVQFLVSGQVEPVTMFDAPVEITPVLIRGRMVNGELSVLTVQEVRYTVFGKPKTDGYAQTPLQGGASPS